MESDSMYGDRSPYYSFVILTVPEIIISDWGRILEMCDNYRMRKYHSVFF